MKQFLQFCVIGGINAVVDIVALNALLAVWPTKNIILLTIFNSIAFTLAVTNSYIMNSRLTFRKQATFKVREKVGFGIQAGTALVVSNVVFLLAFNIIGFFTEGPTPKWWEYNTAKGLSMALSSMYSFLFMKHIIFVRRKKSMLYSLFRKG